MCNPRRVRVRATRELAHAWDQEVRRQVGRRGRAVGEARVREQLAASIGAPTLAALARVLDRTDGWVRDGESFRHAIDGGYVVYHPAGRELEIVAEAGAEVEVTGEASAVVSGRLDETIEAEGIGTHYDDNWGGVTAADARRVADRQAAELLDARAAELVEQAQRRVDEAEGAAVEAAAGFRADAELAEATAARAEQLRRDAAARLVSVGIQARNLFHQGLAEAYRDAILAYARARRADGVSCTERDGVLEIEFELDV